MELFDYATLKVIWWLLIGTLLSGFAIMDGHDMGIGTLLPFVGRNDAERRVVINTVGAHWEGNQTWFITSGGAIFAALPLVYATAFSGFYWAMLAVLWALFFRPVGFKYRSLIGNSTWRNTWDWLILVGSFVPALIFGVALGNVLQGVPFHFDNDLRSTYTGSFWALLNPFALLCGVISVAMLVFHGGVFLMHRTEGLIYQRTRATLSYSAGICLAGFAVAGLWVALGVDGYVITSAIDPNGASDPLNKSVVMQSGAWLHNYARYPLTILIPLLGFAGIGLAWWLARAGWTLLAFTSSALGIIGIIGTVGASMFPFILPSSSDPGSSLIVWDCMSSKTTLLVMLVATVIFLPLIIFYTSWGFRILRGKVTAAYIEEHKHSSY